MLARPAPAWPRIELAALIGGSAIVVVAVVAVSAFEPGLGIGALAGLSALAVVVARPVRAAYLYVALTPLVAGLPRGAFVTQLRPSEALLALLVAGVALRFLTDALGGQLAHSIHTYRITNLDRSILAMAVFSSVIPLTWRAARGFRPLLDDLLFATALWKYLVVFVLFRLVVVDDRQARNCVAVMLSVGAVVGAIAIAQSVNTPGVPEALAALQDEPLSSVTNNRGSSTLGTSHGVADVMAFNLAFCLAFWRLRVGPRWLTGAGALLFGLACFASGQFSAAVALAVVAVAFGWLARRLWRTVAVAVPAIVAAGLLLWPVVQARLTATDETGLPSSWAARRFNLTNYFWSELFRDGNWILGVRPAARLPSYEPWREWVYIESGHTWLLWTGGIPMVLAFAWFTWSSYRASLALSERDNLDRADGRSQRDRFRIALGIGTTVAFSVMFVLMIFDVHLTLRGPADMLFPLLALISVPAVLANRDEYRRAVVGRPVVDWNRLS